MEYPAKICHSRVGGNPWCLAEAKWIPAYAGMTARERQAMRQVQRGSQVMHCQEASRTRLLAAHDLQLLQYQPFEILAFGKVHRRRMIARRAQARDYLRINFGIHRGAGNDLLKQVRVHATGAGKRHQQAFACEQF